MMSDEEYDWKNEPDTVDPKPFSEQKILIQKSTGRLGIVPGWEELGLIAEIWLPIKVRGPEEWDEIVKQHGGDRWCATCEFK